MSAAECWTARTCGTSIYKMIIDIVENAVDTCIAEDSDPEEWDFAELNELLLPIIPLPLITREAAKGHVQERAETGSEAESRCFI